MRFSNSNAKSKYSKVDYLQTPLSIVIVKQVVGMLFAIREDILIFSQRCQLASSPDVSNYGD